MKGGLVFKLGAGWPGVGGRIQSEMILNQLVSRFTHTHTNENPYARRTRPRKQTLVWQNSMMIPFLLRLEEHWGNMPQHGYAYNKNTH